MTKNKDAGESAIRHSRLWFGRRRAQPLMPRGRELVNSTRLALSCKASRAEFAASSAPGSTECRDRGFRNVLVDGLVPSEGRDGSDLAADEHRKPYVFTIDRAP